MDGLKVKFQFSADDLADVAARSTSDSNVLKKWRLQGRILMIALLGLAFYGLVPGDVSSRLISTLVFCGLTLFFLLFVTNGAKRREKLLQFYREKLGGDGPFECEVELSEDALITRQFGTETRHNWSQIASVTDDADGIEFKYRPMGTLMVRSRAFRSIQEREAFLAFARARVPG